MNEHTKVALTQAGFRPLFPGRSTRYWTLPDPTGDTTQVDVCDGVAQFKTVIYEDELPEVLPRVLTALAAPVAPPITASAELTRIFDSLHPARRPDPFALTDDERVALKWVLDKAENYADDHAYASHLYERVEVVRNLLARSESAPPEPPTEDDGVVEYMTRQMEEDFANESAPPESLIDPYSYTTEGEIENCTITLDDGDYHFDHGERVSVTVERLRGGA